MPQMGRLPAELTLPVLGRLTGLSPLGEGAAAIVLRAGDVAVKVARETSSAAITRLRNEAIARAVIGEGVPLDGGFVTIDGRRHPALAYRFVDGAPVATLDGVPPADRAPLLAAIVRDVAGALARLHALGFRHGDVKPDNVLVRREGGRFRASLVDLGLAAPFAEPLVGGTVSQLAPEIVGDDARANGVVGAEADVFALGRTLEQVATRLSAEVPASARAATAKRPGDRPTAAALAGFSARTIPLDAAYVVARRAAIERGAASGRLPRPGAASFALGLARALVGLADVAPSKKLLAAMDRRERETLLALVAGEEARRWSLPEALSDDEVLLGAIALVARTGVVTRGALLSAVVDATNDEGAPEGSLSSAVARVTLHPDDPAALAHLARVAETETELVDDDVAHAAVTLLRRAGRARSARPLSLRRAKNDLARVEAAELARVDRDPEAARALLRDVDAALPEAVALQARLALDAGDLATAESLLAAAGAGASVDRALAEVRGLAAFMRGRCDEGLAALDAATEDDPERVARLLVVRGMLLQGRGDPAAALRSYARAADLALALAAAPLEATARASAAAAAHDAGKLGDALEAGDRAIGLLERLGRHGDAARARLNRAAVLVALGARRDALEEARRAADAADRASDRRAVRYARWVAIDAATAERDRLDVPELAVEVEDDEHDSAGDRLLALAYARLAGRALDGPALARGDRLADGVEPAYARWTWWRAALAAGDARHLELVVRAADHEAPPSVVGPVLALAIDESRKLGRGEVARALVERLARIVTRLLPEVPLAHRATFDGQTWVQAARDGEGRADALGLGAGQIELLAAITRGLRDRTSLADLLRQIVDGLVLWVGVERGLLLLRAPASEGASPDSRLRLVPRVARGLSREDLRGEQLALSHSLAMRALETLEPVVAVDASGDEGELSSSIHALRLRSVLAVPLVARGEPLGVVYLDDRVRRGAFGPREVAWVRLLATQAAAAIADARDALRLRRLARKAERAQRRLEDHLTRAEGALEVARAALARNDAIAPGGDPRGTRHRYDAILGDGPAIRRMLHVIDRVADAADARIPVLIHGESGTGKELVARAIHQSGARGSRPFVAENCGAIPEPLLESTLFGHVRGAFTGADRARVGLFEVANGGSLFLDEIGEMGAAMQAKLLRVLQDGEVRAVGSDKSTFVDVRIIAATHRDLEAMVKERRFREDLFYRLAVVRIVVPPLRERSEDVPMLVEHFVQKFAGDRQVKVTRRALAALAAAPWPGNVRQLENELRRALVLCDDTLDLEHLSAEVARTARGVSAVGGELSLREQVDGLERRLVGEALRRTGGNQTRAAKALGVSRFGLQKMLKRLALEKDGG